MTVDYLEILYRMLAATLIGCALGIERNVHGKPTGIKTLGLVALGSALATMASMDFVILHGKYDMTSVSRSIQGVITGVGFLGAGVIIYNRRKDEVFGLTTAASIWVTAALGIVCGMGMWPIAITSVVIIFLLFLIGRHVEKRLLERWAKRPAEEKEILQRLEE